MAKVMKSKKHKVAPKKVATKAKKVVLVGTYKSGQLEKWPGFYNYPICDGDKIEPEFAKRVNEIWLFNAKKEPVCLRAKFVGFKTRKELKSEFGYPAKGKPHGTGNYILYATSKTRVYSPASGLAEKVIVRLQDFATSKSVQKKLRDYLSSPDRKDPLLANYLPPLLSKLPPEVLRVCEAGDEPSTERCVSKISRREMIETTVAGLSGVVIIPAVFSGSNQSVNEAVELEEPTGGSRSLTAVELFAGIGGFRLACDALGIKTIWANDINESAVKVYRDRFGEDSIVLGDINNLVDQIPQHDILTGGFPCQPFSRAGKKMGIDDYRGTLFETIVKILKKNIPRYFVLENVNSLLFLDNGRNFRTILFALSELGYKIEWRVFNAAAFGLPQQRLRVIICGSREAKDTDSYFVTKAEINAMPIKKREDVAQLRFWNDISSANGKFQQWGLALNGRCVTYDFQPLRGIQRERILHDILQKDVPPEFDFTADTLERIKKSQFVNKFYNGVRILYNQSGGARMGYTIFGTDGLSPTLTASSSRHYERYGIDGKFRRLTNVEYARLQGFPDNHCRAVSVYEQYRLYGNAVPPSIVAYALEKIIKQQTIRFESNELPLFN